MTTRSYEHSLVPAEIAPTSPGTKLLQRLFYYLETNQTWHPHAIHEQQQRQPASKTNRGISLPINAVLWFLEQYAQCQPSDDATSLNTGNSSVRLDHRNNERNLQRDLIQKIKPLLSYCMKLRITSQSWPNDEKVSPPPTRITSAALPTPIPDLTEPRQNSNHASPPISNDVPALNTTLSKQFLMLIKCISYVFPNLHTLWFDQIHWNDLLSQVDDAWMTLLLMGLMTHEIKGTPNSLRVLRIDVVDSIANGDNFNNMNNNMNQKPNLNTSMSSDEVPVIGSARKKRTQVLRRDSNATATIFASLPSTHYIDDSALMTFLSSQETDKSRLDTHTRTGSTCDDQQQTLLLEPDMTNRSTSILTHRPNQNINKDNHLSMDISHIRHFKCTSHQRNFCYPIYETLPMVESLCFSHNHISSADEALNGLDRLPYLQHLDLSFNHLSSLQRAHYQLGRIITLNVSHNWIQVVDGIDRLYSLQILHLDHNRISDLHNTASRLANLPLLKQLYIEGNPCCSEEQLSSSQIQNVIPIPAVESIRNKAQKKRPLYYHVNIWNAFIERRLSAFYKTQDQRRQLTIRDAQNELIPQIDGKLPSKRQWYILQNRVFTTVEQPFVGTNTNHNLDNETTTQTFGPNPARLDLLNSYAFQPNASRRRRSRHKNRATVSIDSSSRKSVSINDDGTLNDKPTDCPCPAFSVYDVVNSLRLPRHVVNDSNIPPSITCLHDSIVPPGATTATTDSDDLLSLDDNIGQQYLDSISQRHISLNSVKLNNFNATSLHHQTFDNNAIVTSEGTLCNDLVTDSNEKHILANGNNRSHATAEASVESSKDLSAVDHDVNGTLLYKANDCDRRDAASIGQSIQTYETLDNLSLCRESIDGSSSPLEQPIRKSNRTNPITAGDSIVNGRTTTVSPSGSPESPQHKLTVLVSSFSESQWQDDNISLPSAIDFNKGSPVGKSTGTDQASRHETFRLAEINSKYVGPKTYQNLLVRENLELYCRLFVFSPSPAPISKAQADDGQEIWRHVVQRYPRIQLWPVDRSKRDEVYRKRETELGKFDILQSNVVDQHEVFYRVWREKVVGCGKPALRRLTPSRAARYGFHGELLWSAAESTQIKPEAVVECRETICCLSNVMFYIIVDHDTVTCKPQKESKREFPLPIPNSATFKDAKWPHALVCHSLDKLRGITIGFGFQRLLLHFEDSASPNSLYVYILLTCNKLETIELLKVFQDLTSTEADLLVGSPSRQTPGIWIENDDPIVLDSLAAAVSPDTVGVVLHYQVLQQKWKSGGRGKVRRVCVVTDSKIYLLDEDYVGDGADTIDVVGENLTRAAYRKELGKCLHRLVDLADLNQIEYVASDDADPNSVTIVMKPITRLTRRRNWRLVCRDSLQGAERLVEDLRKAVSLL